MNPLFFMIIIKRNNDDVVEGITLAFIVMFILNIILDFTLNPISVAIKHLATLLIIVFGSGAAVVFFKMGNHIRKMPSVIWQRNQEIAKLIRKNNKDTITSKEISYLRQFEKEGLVKIVPVINKRKNAWKLYVTLTDNAFLY